MMTLRLHTRFPQTRCASRTRQGVSLVELLVALAVASILVLVIVTTFVMIQRASNDSRRQIEATANARAALETISGDLKALTGPANARFKAENHPLSYGDGIDNDGDGRTDEERPDGLDNDGDWSVASDRQVVATTFTERTHYVGKADFGDAGVDEDCVFNRDALKFRINPPANPRYPYDDTNYDYEDVQYTVRTYDGLPDVLVRSTVRMKNGAVATSSSAPLAYNVLSFNCLYWDPNVVPSQQYWLETWDSEGTLKGTVNPRFLVPAAVLVEITVHADPKPPASYTAGEPVETVTMRTIVDVERVIQSPRFPRSAN